MRFLDDVVTVTSERIRTRAELRQGHILESGNGISALIAIEIFAQSAAALLAHRARSVGQAQVSGALLGSRRVDFLVPRFRIGDVLEAEVSETWGAGELAQFDGTLFREREVVAQGSINVVSGSIP